MMLLLYISILAMFIKFSSLANNIASFLFDFVLLCFILIF